MSAFIHITGNVGKEPTFETTPSGAEVAKVSVCVNIYKGRDKEGVANWYNVTVWGKMGETLRDWRKGDTVSVCGRLEQRAYESQGQARTSLDVTASEVSNLSKFVKPRGEAGGGGYAAREAPMERREPAKAAPRREETEDDLPF